MIKAASFENLRKMLIVGADAQDSKYRSFGGITTYIAGADFMALYN